MSWIALLLLASDVTGTTAAWSPSNTASRSDDTAAESSATPPTPRATFAEHPVTIESRLGIASPTGMFGGALSYSPVPEIGLDCGAGTNGKGLQLACGLRARLILDVHLGPRFEGTTQAVTLTSGFSTGAYEDDHDFEKLIWVDGPGPANRSYQRAYWWNTDLGLEQRYETLVLRFYAGAALLLNPDAGIDIVTHDEHVEPPTTKLFYFGLGLGVLP